MVEREFISYSFIFLFNLCLLLHFLMKPSSLMSLIDIVFEFSTRVQTTIYWFAFEGSRIFRFCYQTCSPSVHTWTQVCWNSSSNITAYSFLMNLSFQVNLTINFMLWKVKLTPGTINYCRKDLPLDLAEGVLEALSLQALGQVKLYGLLSTFASIKWRNYAFYYMHSIFIILLWISLDLGHGIS